jgi:enamine deaminase RidA (YjgF/YER057c/UK114 family)
MTADRINPDTLYDSLPFGFSHAAISPAGRMLHLAGQVAWDKDGTVIGAGDLAAQARQALSNLRAVLESQGVTPADLVRIRTYVVDHTPDKLGIVAPEMMTFYGDAMPAPNTWIGVAALALPEFLIEIEATAILSD